MRSCDPRRQSRAEWFAEIWHRLEIPVGWHYRRIHYKLISTVSPLPFWRGGDYENTEKCWRELNNAAKDAAGRLLVAAAALLLIFAGIIAVSL